MKRKNLDGIGAALQDRLNEQAARWTKRQCSLWSSTMRGEIKEVEYQLPMYANEGGTPDSVLAPALKSLSDICTFGRDTDPLALLKSTAGDFAPDMGRIFPNDWAWAAVAVPRSTRQIWFAVLSGFQALPADCTQLRSNLLTLDQGLMLRLRFGELAATMGSIVSRIDRYPLRRGQYDKLARILVADPTVITWYDGRPGVIETDDLSELVSEFVLEPLPSQEAGGRA